MVSNDLQLSAGFAENFLHVLLLDLDLLQLCQDILAGFLHEPHQVNVELVGEAGQECVEEEGGGDGEERPVEAGGEEEEAAREDGAGEEPTFPEYQSHQQTHCVNLPAENLTYKLLQSRVRMVRRPDWFMFAGLKEMTESELELPPVWVYLLGLTVTALAACKLAL